MNLNQVRKEIEQIKQHLCADETRCTCHYVEINDDEPTSRDAQEIIEANQKCSMLENVSHVGYAKIIISRSASSASDEQELTQTSNRFNNNLN